MNGPLRVWNSVEKVAMRQPMADEHGQRALGIAMRPRFEFGRAPHRRSAAVCADDQPSRDRAAVSQARTDGARREIVCRHVHGQAFNGEDRANSAPSASAIELFSIFHPNASSPISEQWNSTGRGGNSVLVSSMRRKARSGAAFAANGAHRPRDF